MASSDLYASLKNILMNQMGGRVPQKYQPVASVLQTQTQASGRTTAPEFAGVGDQTGSAGGFGTFTANQKLANLLSEISQKRAYQARSARLSFDSHK